MPNESPSGNSLFGDGIYYHEEEEQEDKRQDVESATLLSIRKRLLDEYIKSRIEDNEHDECGCHFKLDLPSDDLNLLDELSRCYREEFSATDEELRSISSKTTQPQRPQRQQQSSKQWKQSQAHKRVRQQQKQKQKHQPQQVTSITREGSAFTRLITPAADKPEWAQQPQCSPPKATTTSIGDVEDEASISTGAVALANHRPVAHRHRQRKSVVVSNGREQHYGISGREQPVRLFIDDSESVQSSSVAPSGCCCCWQCFAENNNNNSAFESGGGSSSREQNLVHREIYEPRSEPAGAAATTADYYHREPRSWPCYPTNRAGRASASHQSFRGNSLSGLRSNTSPHKPEARGQFFITKAPPQGEESTSGSESSEDLDKFDTRSALDCVEEISPTWSDLSSVQIENSDQIPDSRELEEDEDEEEELARGASASNLASWFRSQTMMETDDNCSSQERNNNNNVAFERQFGSDFTNVNSNSNYELEARSECARPPPSVGQNYSAGYQPNQELDEKREAPVEPRRTNSTEQTQGRTKTKTPRKTKRKKRKREEADHKEQQQQQEEVKEEKGYEADLSNCIAESERQQQQQATVHQSECESASMRAARDFAKLSVPSLASLQYLPGQLDVKPAKMVDRKANQVKSTTSKVASPTRPNASVSRVIAQEIDEPQSISAHARETAETANEKHDESCLLDRLCMCNCMAGKRPRSVDQAAATAASEAIPTSQPQQTAKTGARSSPARDASPKGSRASSRAEARASPVSLSESVDLHEDGERDVMPSSSSRVDIERNASSSPREAPSPAVVGNVVNVRDDAAVPAVVASSSRSGGEKQSPTFLGLLRPAAQQAHSGGAAKKQALSRGHPLETGTRVQSSKGFGAGASSRVLGSIDDLEASGRSSSSASGSQAASDFCSPPSSAASSSAAARFASGKRGMGDTRLLHKEPSAAEIRSGANIQPSEQETGKTPQCRNCNSPTGAHDQDSRRRKPAYKQLLSPSKLFNSSSSHSSICEDCKQPDATQSFLSRSLSRLSGRSAGKHSRASPVPAGEQQDQQQVPPRQAAVVPAAKQELPAELSPSVSNHSHLDTYCSNSINSLEEEINLCHSLPYEVNLRDQHADAPSKNSTRLLRTPEIVLSRVEYQDLQEEDDDDQLPSCLSECSCQQSRMTRSTSGLGQRRHTMRSHGRHSSCRNHDNQMYERVPPQRHGSEISFQTSSDGSTSLTHGPFSLPASPRASRRHRHLSRSPRLSSSPVPFHSPASESTKIEDGLKVCSTGHFEKHIGNIKGNQIEAQKRLFTAWINHYAPNLIVRDLFVELQDGIKLIGLLATLTRDRRLLTEYERLNRDKRTYVNRLALTPSSRLTHISNVHIAIDYMRTNLGMKLVNLNPMDIVSGKENVILGLCWNIILHFQLSRDLLSSGSEASSVCGSTSRLSANNRGARRQPLSGKGASTNLVDELSSKDLVTARGKLLAHINKRFNLKLTNLTSSLLDGDVLLAIIKQTVPSNSLHDDSRPASWPQMDDNEKLDTCFQLAQDYLNVPWLISASDLRRETLSERNSKPLLVYLSMLLKANPRDCSTDQMLELRQLEESLGRVGESKPDVAPTKEAGVQQVSSHTTTPSENQESELSHEQLVRNYLDDLDSDDKFHIDKLQTTLANLNRLGELVESTSGLPPLDATQLERVDKLKRQAEQVDCLISWINAADKLFETKQEASCDLAKASELYDQSVVFFSPSNLPQIDTSLCPTLERQYRECLAAARQHILSLEQIMKNWTSHRQATKELKDWLITAELKLESALRPNGHLTTATAAATTTGCLQERLEFGSDEHIDAQKNRLGDLIEFFELEQIDVDDLDMLSPINNPFASLDGGRSSSLSNFDHTAEQSLSGSLLSLGSTGSRMSTLASSKRAAHHRLFDNLELQSHLLAATLEPEQRDTILTGVKTFNLRMKQILEYKVPQVISDICLSINRCKMQIREQDEEQDELSSELELEDLSDELAAVDRAVEFATCEERPLVGDNLEMDQSGQTSPETTAALISDKTVVSPPLPTSQARSRQNNGTPVSPSKIKRQKRKAARAQQSRSSNNHKSESATIKITATSSSCSDDNECEPFYRLLWDKLVRASRMSLSFNIVLLICLAGICVVPLIQKDACCELSQAPIPTERFTVNQRPT